MTISGNTVLITGGATGIGLALAEALVTLGNEVIVCGRRRDRLAAARARLPQVHVRVCDVSNSSARRALVTWSLARCPRLNVLVNNAGVQWAVDLRKGARDLPHADEEIATNFAAPIHLSALLVPHLRRRKAAAIVNISSGLAFTPLAAVPVYCATKAAIHSLSLSTMSRERDFGPPGLCGRGSTVASRLPGCCRGNRNGEDGFREGGSPDYLTAKAGV